MNKRLFGRDGRPAQLPDLYRRAEQGRVLPDVDPELQQEFAADQQFIRQLGRLASRSAPANPDIRRGTFLAAVARQKSESLEEERRTMFGQRLGARGLALLAVAGIFVGGTATVGASGGVTGAAGNANDVLATLHVPHRSHGHGHGNSNAADKKDDSGTPDDAAAPQAEGTERPIKGIPADNAQHQPADSNGICEKGETVVKTTPSGVMVNVPCQAVEGGNGEGKDKTPKADRTPGADEQDANETPEADETPDANETPEADETPGVDESGNHGQGDAQSDDAKTPEPEETEQTN